MILMYDTNKYYPSNFIIGQDEVVNLGGPGRVVEVGVISLGTSNLVGPAPKSND